MPYNAVIGIDANGGYMSTTRTVWDYQVLRLKVNLRRGGEGALQEALDTYGEAGWEVVSINWIDRDDKAIVVFKRPRV